MRMKSKRTGQVRRREHAVVGRDVRGTSRLIAAAFALLTLVAPMPALAQETDDWTAQVSHGDLDLATAAGSAELRARVAAAVRKHCRTTQRETLGDRDLQARCVEAALKRSTSAVAIAITRAERSRQVADVGGSAALGRKN